ncbi:MAG: hypothetical protein Q4B54_06925 [Coriobacteriales bacterium]|nr:hypothetical protein [Coriobacteriales bacterium]
MIDYDDISPELKEKAMQCESTEELFELAQSEGVDLTDEMIEQIAGGSYWSNGLKKKRWRPTVD